MNQYISTQKSPIRILGSFQLAIGIGFFFDVLYGFVRQIRLYEKSSKKNGITDVHDCSYSDVQRSKMAFEFGDVYVIVN